MDYNRVADNIIYYEEVDNFDEDIFLSYNTNSNIFEETEIYDYIEEDYHKNSNNFLLVEEEEILGFWTLASCYQGCHELNKSRIPKSIPW